MWDVLSSPSSTWQGLLSGNKPFLSLKWGPEILKVQRSVSWCKLSSTGYPVLQEQKGWINNDWIESIPCTNQGQFKYVKIILKNNIQAALQALSCSLQNKGLPCCLWGCSVWKKAMTSNYNSNPSNSLVLNKAHIAAEGERGEVGWGEVYVRVFHFNGHVSWKTQWLAKRAEKGIFWRNHCRF